MNVQTTYSGPRKKPFSFSYSKLKNFEVCPKKHHAVDIAKTFKEDESDALMWGNTLHKAFAERASKGTKLPKSMEEYEPLLQRLIYPANPTGNTLILVEQQMAIREDFSPCEWFAKDAWYRGIADLVRIQGPVALAVDYKTGKVKEDGVQLGLMAQCLFSHHPSLMAIRTEFIWLAEDATTRADFKRADMPKLWAGVLPRVAQLKQAYETDSYPAKPGGLCRKWCPVSDCPHHGK